MLLKHIVIAIDSFKGSLSSTSAGQAAAAACRALFPAARIDVFPLADGGEGTVDALTTGLRGCIVPVTVTGPLGTPVKSRYGLLPETRTAVIEMADAAGLTLVPPSQRNPLHTTTYGLGELVLAACKAGCRDFIIGIGGSATNDCGLGMLTALGWRFLRRDGTVAGITGGDLASVVTIDSSAVEPPLADCRFRIACDVTNPLYGPDGCSAVFGPQKGATPAIVKDMDAAACQFSRLAERATGRRGATLPGAGAAGGLGFAFHTFLRGTLVPGSELCLDAIGIRDALRDADLLITGEGRMDAQTSMGKGPVGVATLARTVNHHIRTFAVCGCALPEAEIVNAHGIDAYFPILHLPTTAAEAMKEQTARSNLQRTVTQCLRLLTRV